MLYGEDEDTDEGSGEKTLLTEVEPKAVDKSNASPTTGKNLNKDKSQNQLKTIRPLDE